MIKRLKNIDLLNALYEHGLTKYDFQGMDFSPEALSPFGVKKADFTNKDLSGADFSHANLMMADFTNSNLSGANLTSANLRGARLVGTDFTNANLSNSILSNTDTRGANMRKANMIDAELENTNILESINIKEAIFNKKQPTELAGEMSFIRDKTKEIITEIPYYNESLIIAENTHQRTSYDRIKLVKGKEWEVEVSSKSSPTVTILWLSTLVAGFIALYLLTQI